MASFFSLDAQNTSNHGKRFEQLGSLIPGANAYRNTDGAPGPAYWQNTADYDIQCTLDTENLRLVGKETITYMNESPHTLRYLWLQLDENQHSPDNVNQYFDASKVQEEMSERQLLLLEPWRELEQYGCKIEAVSDENGKALKHTINSTMMRIELPEPLNSGEQFSFNVNWHYQLIDRINPPTNMPTRGGYEYFEDEDDYIFTITQWFPRMCSFNDYEGWQNKQFTGRGEFALPFGNYVVKMTLPDDYMVGATGECLNYPVTLSPTQLARWEKAQEANEPLEIVTLSEAKANAGSTKSKKLQTWIYQADNVRDFAWTASRKFIWDAMPYRTEDERTVMCMSYYPEESYPIYSKYSTKTVAQTLKTYSKYTIPYPYPAAISVEAASGMEYPMICFNPGRAEEDGTYTEAAKNSAITVIIHEVGHNYFPMIINSDERHWAWFDEGLNTFLHTLTEQEFDNNYQSMTTPDVVTSYMNLPPELLEPIMTTSDNIVNYFQNAYLKPAAALNLLRETIMGRELFDFAFKEYSRRWAFKHPTPADFFRTMEDASGVDLDWFWRAWFYGIEKVDVSLDDVRYFQADLVNDPPKREYEQENVIKEPFEDISKKRNRASGMKFAVEEDKSLQDFYTHYRPWDGPDSIQTTKIKLFEETFSSKEKEELFGDKHYYELSFSNKGGLVTPVIVQWTFEDGSKEIQYIPAEIWRKNENSFKKVFVKDKVVSSILIDPYRETLDVNESNNVWEVNQQASKFKVYKNHKMGESANPMQKAKKK